MQTTVHVFASNEVLPWLLSATPEQIGLALIYGYKNVPAVEAMTKPVVLTTVAPVVEIAQVKGVRGESHVMDALRDEFKCELVTGKTAAGDISIWFDNVKLCVEVKNYTKAIPTQEVTKFLRDLETTGAQAGLFISLNTRITGITENVESRLHPTTLGGMIPIMYICCNDPHVIVASAKFVILQAQERRTAAIERAAAHAEVMQVDRAIDLCAHARMQTYELAGLCTQQLAKIAGTIQTAEACARDCIDRVGGVVINPVDMPKAIMDALPGNWTSTARRRNHPSGISIDTGKKTPLLLLPPAMMTHMDAVIALGGTVSRDGASIPLTDETIAGCLKMLRA
jgi:Restriction endonuclease